MSAMNYSAGNRKIWSNFENEKYVREDFLQEVTLLSVEGYVAARNFMDWKNQKRPPKGNWRWEKSGIKLSKSIGVIFSKAWDTEKSV